MKVLFPLLVLFSFSAKASPLLSVKDRLRLHMWAYGLELEKPVKKTKMIQHKILPEEIERPLRKI